MKKEYMTPEAEMMKFEEIEDVMIDASTGVWEGPLPGDWN